MEERLLEMGVFIPAEEDSQPDDDYRLMTSRNVYDWRFRDGHWVRRSRLVARDYKFLQPELEGLLSRLQTHLEQKFGQRWYKVLEEVYIVGRCLPGHRV